jgi:hypothetical protein
VTNCDSCGRPATQWKTDVIGGGGRVALCDEHAASYKDKMIMKMIIPESNPTKAKQNQSK